MKIGITERSDPSINNTWIKNINNVDAAILITKRLTKPFIDEIIKVKEKIILHHSITGYGSIVPIEPNIYNHKIAFEALDYLIHKGFKKEQIVIRVDPIIPTEKYFKLSKIIFEKAIEKKYTRLRFSFMDMYKHVQNRFLENSLTLEPFNISECINDIVQFKNKIQLECCCEKIDGGFNLGCVSIKDLEILGLNQNEIKTSSFKQRPLCSCLPKIELLDVEQKQRCPLRCIYCYWK